MFSVFHSCVLYWLGLSYIAFIMLRYVHSIPALFRVFIMNGCWILSNTFYVSIKMIMWFFASCLLFYLIDFAYIEPPLWTWDESHSVEVYDLFYVLLDSVCWYFFENFCIHIHQRYWFNFLFLVVSLSGFGLRVMVAS